jgi:predicted enzyme related to lactoylglutathione lyase
MKLSAIRIFVRDLAEARRFYADVLELSLKSDAAEYGYCVFDTGGTQLILEAVAPDRPADDQALVGRFTGLSFATEDIHRKHKELLARGIQFTSEPELQFWGGWLATLKDPSGNAVQLVQLSA